jgi:uncharacterized protein
MLADEIRRRLREAMRARDALAKDVLRVALGEIESATARQAGELPEADAEALVRKLVKSDREVLAASDRPEQQERLRAEIALLEDLLPRTLDVDDVVRALGPVADAVRAAPGDGPATGIAMKHLKAAGAAVQGKDVAEAVRRLRG